jgi:hypothetical protein
VVIVVAVERPRRSGACAWQFLVAVFGGGCPFHLLWCVSCSGRVASFVHRCRSSVLGVHSVDFVLYFVSCIGQIVWGSPQTLFFLNATSIDNLEALEHNFRVLIIQNKKNIVR